MKTTLLFATAAASAAALATTAVGGAASGPTTLKLTQRDRFFHFVDVPPRKGDRRPTPGDQFIIRAAVDGGGTATSTCSFTKAAAACASTFALPEGTITLQGVLSFTAKANTVAVTGGTGRYAGASGSARIGNSSSGGRTPVTIRLAG